MVQTQAVLKIKIWSFIILIFLLLNCSRNPNDSGQGFLELQGSALIEISHGDEILSNYLFKSKVLGEDSLYSFDPKTNSLSLFDLKSKSIRNRVIFTLDGPDFIEDGIKDFWVDSDKIIFLGSSYISVFDHRGSLIKRIENGLIPNYRDEFIFDKFFVKNDSLAILSVDHLQGRLANVPQLTRLPLFLRLNLNNLEFNYLDIQYPEEAFLNDVTQGYYGKTPPVSFFELGDDIVYSFSFNSKVYFYNPETNKSRSFRVNSNLSENDKPPLDAALQRNTKEFIKFGLSGLNFFPIRYDELEQRFYRTHTVIEEERNKKRSRTLYLTMFDLDQNVIADSELNEDFTPYLLINKGQVMAVTREQIEGVHQLALLSFQ